MLRDGYHDLPPGHLASAVTHLEMRAPPVGFAPPPPRDDLRFKRSVQPDLDAYLDLFRAVGADWLWFSRLNMARDAVAQIIHDDNVEVYALRDAAGWVALVELDFRESGACELAYFGLVPSQTGKGTGGWLMRHAIARAFSRPIERFHVHTCTLDSPAALPFYIRSGFTPIKRQVEVGPDPRLSGTLPRDAAPQVPIL